ncbi:MAG TPA: hypothetical protein VL048_08315 [Xanthobacteraceae bacterium]|nr:hypothetical protein [Xanthobacteraceae bacterium]
MSSINRAIKLAAAVAAAVTILLSAATPSQAETCSIRLHIVKAGFIVGVGGGSGVLVCHGRAVRLSVGGIGIGSLGVAAVDLRGTASNVRTPGSVAGTYGAAGAGATFVGGGQAATLQNGNGVVLQLAGPQVGFQVSLGLGGMTLALR